MKKLSELLIAFLLLIIPLSLKCAVFIQASVDSLQVFRVGFDIDKPLNSFHKNMITAYSESCGSNASDIYWDIYYSYCPDYFSGDPKHCFTFNASYLCIDSVCGDVYCRGLNCSAFLFPDIISFETEKIKAGLNNTAAIYQQPPGFFNPLNSDEPPPEYENRLYKPVFAYSDTVRNRFIQYLNNVDNYLAASRILKYHLREISRLLNNSGSISLSELATLIETNTSLHVLAKQNFITFLALDKEDPEKYLGNIDILSHRLGLAQRSVLKRAEASVPVFDSISPASLKNELLYRFSSRNEEDINIQSHFRSEKLINDIASYQFNGEFWNDFLAIIEEKKDAKASLSLLLHTLPEVFLMMTDSIEKELEEEHYYDAKYKIKRLNSFARQSFLSLPTEKIQDLSYRADTGIISSYIAVFSKALSAGHTDIAVKWLTDADVYFEKAGLLENNRLQIQYGYKYLFEFYLMESKKYSLANNFNQAYLSLSKAENIAPEIQGIVNTAKIIDNARSSIGRNRLNYLNRLALNYKRKAVYDSIYLLIPEMRSICQSNSLFLDFENDTLNKLLSDVNALTMKSALMQAKKYISGEHYLKALSLYDSLLNLPDKNYTINNENLKQAVFPLIKSMLSRARMHIWGNEPEKSTAILRKADSLAGRYDVLPDSSLVMELQEVEDLIEMKRCSKFSLAYSRLILRNEERVSALKYQEARLAIQYFEKAYDLNTLECDVDFSKFWEMKAEILPLAKYQDMIDKLDLFYKAHSFREMFLLAFSVDSIAGKLYSLKFPVPQFSIRDMVLSFNDNSLLKPGIRICIDHSRYKDAVDLLSLAKELGFDSKDYRNEQKQLGRQLGNDMNYSDIISLEILDKSLLKSDWFHYLRNAFSPALPEK